MRDLLALIVISTWEVIRATFQFFMPKLKKPVTGEVVLITGAAQGIGRELALKYALEGATVVCVDIDQKANLETVRMIGELGKIKGYAYMCDVSDYQNVMDTCKQIEEEVGNVTILVNNAAVLFANRFWEWSKSEIESTINVNLLGNLWMVKAILPSMMKNNYGHIVAMSSMACFVSSPNITPYGATKCAIKGFMDGLRNELAMVNNRKIKVTTVYPYVIETQMAKLCKMKYPSLMPSIKPKRAAEVIVSAQRRDVENLTIPTHYFLIPIVLQFLPIRVSQLWMNYVQVSFQRNN